MARAERLHLKEHHVNLKDKESYPSLIEYAYLRLVVCMVRVGVNVMAGDCKILGATKPFESAMSSIDWDFCLETRPNLRHGSDDAVESAEETKP